MKKIIRWFRRLDPNCVKKARDRLVQHRYDKAAIVMAKMADKEEAAGNHGKAEYIRLVNFAIQATRHLN